MVDYKVSVYNAARDNNMGALKVSYFSKMLILERKRKTQLREQGKIRFIVLHVFSKHIFVYITNACGEEYSWFVCMLTKFNAIWPFCLNFDQVFGTLPRKRCVSLCTCSTSVYEFVNRAFCSNVHTNVRVVYIFVFVITCVSCAVCVLATWGQIVMIWIMICIEDGPLTVPLNTFRKIQSYGHSPRSWISSIVWTTIYWHSFQHSSGTNGINRTTDTDSNNVDTKCSTLRHNQ